MAYPQNNATSLRKKLIDHMKSDLVPADNSNRYWIDYLRKHISFYPSAEKTKEYAKEYVPGPDSKFTLGTFYSFYKFNEVSDNYLSIFDDEFICVFDIIDKNGKIICDIDDGFLTGWRFEITCLDNRKDKSWFGKFMDNFLLTPSLGAAKIITIEGYVRPIDENTK